MFLGLLLFAVQVLLKPLSTNYIDQEITAIDCIGCNSPRKPSLKKALKGDLPKKPQPDPLLDPKTKSPFPSIFNMGLPGTSNVNVLVNVKVL